MGQGYNKYNGIMWMVW